MKPLLLSFLLAIALPAAARDLVVAVGRDGEPAYGPIFRKQAETWTNAAKQAGFNVRTIGLDDKTSARTDLQNTLAALPKDGDDLWLVLIGHGNSDGRSAKFNLRGDDVSATELASWLAPFRRPVVVWNLFSASGAFLPDLSRANRIIVSATRSGTERNYSRFGEKVSELLVGPDADLDGDGTVTIVELVATATARTVTAYENDQRLLSEHAVLDDNGDGAGAESATLLKPEANSTHAPDGKWASTISLARGDSAPALTPEQQRMRNELEARIAKLREAKPAMNETVYYRQLENLLLDLARIYQGARKPSN
jgi:hypothetical protein